LGRGGRFVELGGNLADELVDADALTHRDLERLSDGLTVTACPVKPLSVSVSCTPSPLPRQTIDK
jgi:hypothetical protein